LAYVGITRGKKEVHISCCVSRIYHGDWIESMPSRFFDEIPKKNVQEDSFENYDKQDEDEMEFNQDIDYEKGIKSPGWARLQRKKLKYLK